MSDQNQQPTAVMMQLLGGLWLSQAICCAAELGIADLLNSGPRDVAEIAKDLGANEDALYRLLKCLTAFGVFAQPAPRRFALTPLGDTLRTDSPQSLRGVARLHGHETFVRSWARLPYSVRTGKPSLDEVTGMTGFEVMENDLELAAIFNEAMRSYSNSESEAILAMYDFSGIGTLADVGGGYGHLLAAVLGNYPEMKGVLFDLAHTVEGARRTLADASIANRVEIVTGDFFAGSPPPCDAVIMKHVIHDWTDEASIRILKSCAASLRPGGKLLLAEMVEPAGPVPHPAKLMDLQMLVLSPGGRQRNEAEFASLFAQAGLRLVRVLSSPSPISIIEGVLA